MHTIGSPDLTADIRFSDKNSSAAYRLIDRQPRITSKLRAMCTPRLPALTLIVATTPSLGLGFQGTLPWPPLKSDLAFFARVTKRYPLPHATGSLNSPNNHTNVSTQPQANVPRSYLNAVIMGHKTWDSIPLKFRPLKGRINVVVSRQSEGGVEIINGDILIRAGSIEEGIKRLQHEDWACKIEDQAQAISAQDKPNIAALGRVFVIGGAQIYQSALRMDCCERILWTQIEREWMCDVWFPKGVFEQEGRTNVWERKGRQELDEWCGEKGVGERKEEDGVGYTIEMWERNRIDTGVESRAENSDAG